MRRHGPVSLFALFLGFVSVSLPSRLYAQAHFSPGVANIRDYAEPGPGLYLEVCNYGYLTSRLNDDNGNQISSVMIGPPGGPNATLNIDVNVNIYALSPLLLWVTPWKFLGANYGMYIAPAFSNSNVTAALMGERGGGFNPKSGQFASGDLFVQPLWLGWHQKHFDTSFGYGFYAPVGKYDVQTITFPNFPNVPPAKVTASDNTGLGYWTNQLSGNVTWYPNPNHLLAVTNTLTFEVNTRQRSFDLTNGDFFTWNWGASKYLMLAKKGTPPKYLLELGVAGYDQWQITDTTGSDAMNGNLHDSVHGVGFQIGTTYLPKSLAVTFRYMDEYAASNRFQGHSFGLNVAYVIKTKPPASAPPPPTANPPAARPPGL
jgi:hypothetical protein